LRNPKKHLRAKTRAGLVPNESQPRHKRERSSFFLTMFLTVLCKTWWQQ